MARVVLSGDDVERLRERVKSESPDRSLHLSTFVIAYAYTWSCLVKARGGNAKRSVSFLFVGDFRERLDPPLPATYFGNCMFPAGSYNRKAVDFAEERGFVTAVEILSDLVKGLSSRKTETIVKEFADAFDSLHGISQFEPGRPDWEYKRRISGGENPLRLMFSPLMKEGESQWQRDVRNQVEWRSECA